ncbi:MAG: DUF559 domain-containing protein [Actinobacteria bacterium]|uniref:Unannotated protein n=1 Tax=freshwater metagenome TaxID=449393 RepID=A0A6J7LGF3_9ZZZZ|nr:DUF559 domain-containing protein [Actinomycetota bacterium]
MSMVFVTQTGSRYHASADMPCLENASGTALVPLETAVAGGLQPCITCDAPPVPESSEGDRQWLRAIDDWARAGVFESFWEQAFARRVLASTAGISSDDVEPQCYISVGSETYKVDFSVPKAGLVLEVDGYAKDGAPLTASDVERRNRRDAALQTHGLTVLHFSNAQVQQEPQACRAQISGAIAARTTPVPPAVVQPVPQVEATATPPSPRSSRGLLIGLAAASVVAMVGVLLAVNSGSVDIPAVASPSVASSVAASAVAGAGPTTAGAAEPLAEGSCPAAFPIKGNINDAGERIAHTPGQQFYERTDAEECFADLAAAAAGGFRASTR